MPSTNKDYQKVRYMSVDEMQKLSNTELINLIKQSAYYANKRRDKVMNYYEKNPNAVISPSYKELDKPEKMKPSFKKAKEKEFYSWSTYNFDIPKNLNLNKLPNLKDYLIGKLMKNIRFLDNKTSTVYGIRKMLSDFEKRLEERGANIESIKNITSDQEKYQELWRLYNEIASEYNPKIASNLSSNELQVEITEILSEPEYDYEHAKTQLRKKEDNKYKKKKTEEKSNDIIDSFTDLGGGNDEFETDRL